MLNDRPTNAVTAAPTNVGLAALHIAVAQAEVFRKTLAEVSDRADQTAKELERKAEQQQQALRERLAAARGGVDILVNDNTKTNSATKKEANQGVDQNATLQAPGGGVNIKA